MINHRELDEPGDDHQIEAAAPRSSRRLRLAAERLFTPGREWQ
jgi:hypothetical protein